MDTAKAEEIIEPTKFCYKERLYGPLPNQDTWIGTLGSNVSDTLNCDLL